MVKNVLITYYKVSSKSMGYLEHQPVKANRNKSLNLFVFIHTVQVNYKGRDHICKT